MLRTDSREHLFVPETMSEEQLPFREVVGTPAPHSQPEVSGRVARAYVYDVVIRDRIVQLFRQRSVLAVPHFDA
jgi:hypothetical protein